MSLKIQMTKNYRMFTRNSENRPPDAKKHKKLLQSMEVYGFLPCFPIVVRRKGELLVVKEGQHRLMFAEQLGLPVYWVETEVDFDIAVINNTPKTWALRDYATKHALNGHKAYQEGLDFAERHGLSVGTAFSLLAGTTSFTNCQEQFVDGTFKIKDREWAEDVAGTYVPMTLLSADLKGSRFVEACMAVCRAPGFDSKRLLANAKRCRELLVSYSTRDAYLDMVERIYNYGRHQQVGLKAQATMALRERSVVGKAKEAAANGKGKEAVSA